MSGERGYARCGPAGRDERTSASLLSEMGAVRVLSRMWGEGVSRWEWRTDHGGGQVGGGSCRGSGVEVRPQSGHCLLTLCSVLRDRDPAGGAHHPTNSHSTAGPAGHPLHYQHCTAPSPPHPAVHHHSWLSRPPMPQTPPPGIGKQDSHVQRKKWVP